MQVDLSFKYKTLVDYLINEKPFEPDFTLVLGSGLGGFANSLKIIKSFPTKDLPGFPESTVEGHSGIIHFAESENKKLLLFQGRIHFYEGYKLSECILPSFITYKLKCRKILLTNAAGGINRQFKPGDLMMAASFNGIEIKKELTELIGVPSEKIHNEFLNFPSSEMNTIIRKSAVEEKIDLKEGVYWYSKGPSYETPAEIEMMHKFGGDAVGMSTVPEAVFAVSMGMKVAAISCITNYAAGISKQKLTHDEVTETANRVENKFSRLVKRIINSI
jgi:purine-nucleoside phosphorylase